MQRTVKGKNFTVAKIVINNGVPEVENTTVKIAEANTEKATKKLFKMYPDVKVLNVEDFEILYKLDDEIFFKYAVEVEQG